MLATITRCVGLGRFGAGRSAVIADLPTGTQAALVVTIVLAVVDWYAVWNGNDALEYFAKPATLVALISATVILAMTEGAVVSTTEAWLFVVALVFSLGGDVALMVLRDNIIPGLVSFLIGHVLYIVGLNVLELTHPFALLGGVIAVAVFASFVCAFVFDWFRGRRERPALIAYMVVIGFMVASALTLPWRVGVPAASAAAGIAGAALFFFSDSMIAYSRFVEAFPRSHFWIMTTYHLGQIGLVLSLAA